MGLLVRAGLRDASSQLRFEDLQGSSRGSGSLADDSAGTLPDEEEEEEEEDLRFSFVVGQLPGEL